MGLQAVFKAMGVLSGSAAKTGMRTSMSSVSQAVTQKQFTGLGMNVIGLGVSSAATLMMSPPETRGKDFALNTGMYLLTAGMGPGRALFASLAFSAAPMAGDAVRMVTSANRAALDARTMLSVPFSYSTQSMDLAGGSLQYARQRMGQAYSMVGSEASFLAARYTNGR